MVLVILGIGIKIETLSVGKWSMSIHISRWHTFDFESLSTLTATCWRRCISRRWGQWRWRCTCSFASPAYLRILPCAILARKAAVHLIFTNHCWLSFHRSMHVTMPRKFNSQVLLFSDVGVTFLNQILRFLD